jgi:hypothetical protein
MLRVKLGLRTRLDDTRLARKYRSGKTLTQRLLGVSMLAMWKEALNWFFKEARGYQPVGTAGPAVRNMKTGRRTEPVRPTNVMTDKTW